MTFIAAKRRYRRRSPLPNGRRPPGRPPIRSHVVGVWATSTWDGRIYPAWHVGRTLVCLAGQLSRSSWVMIELDSDTAKPDWQAVALKKRLRREGFRDVIFGGQKDVFKSLLRKNLSRRPKTAEIDSDIASEFYN